MTRNIFLITVLAWGSAALTPALRAQETVAQQLGIIDERLKQLAAQVEALQFNQERLKKDCEDLRAQMLELRRANAGGADLAALEARIKEVDAARERDKQVIIDQVAKELAALGGASRPRTNYSGTPSAGNEHVVLKGEYLSTIARKYGVTVSDLKRANNLTTDIIREGQKLVIPK